MNKNIYIGVAWPYANGELHLGHIAGCYLPADIFARFQRLIGNKVLMVSGSDEHGTPVTITAEEQNKKPQQIVDFFNKKHLENMSKLRISFDLFTRTTTENHKEVVQEIFKTLYEKDYIYRKEVEAFYCKNCGRYLPDRYIEGTCPKCENEESRGDQCDECGAIHDPQDLYDPRCKICGNKPKIRESEHFFFALNKFEDKLKKWVKQKKHWKKNVYKFTQNWLDEGLQDRAITRDMKWGIKVPFEEFEEKRIYVWFDAVIGYLSASKEWANRVKKPEKWKEWWKNPDSKHYYFLAKDNIPFHSIIWPSILMGYDPEMQLPYDIPANEYLRLEGEQFSKSRGLAIWVLDILEKFDVDSIRYYLSINMPEKRDSNWIWEDFVSKINNELVGTYGNFVHRVLTFTHKNFGEIPQKKQTDEIDEKILKEIEKKQKHIKLDLEKCEFKKALKKTMNLAQKGNVYFNDKKPWKLIKEDREKCGTVLNVCLRIVKALAVFTSPFLPKSSDKIWKKIGYKKSIHKCKWEDASKELNTFSKLEKPKPLFKKLSMDDIMVEKTEDEFSKLDLRVGKIVDVKDHPNADKLYMLQVELGELGKRVLVAGMKPYYKTDEIKNKKIVVITNLKPAKIRGVKSNGMLLAAEDNNGTVSLLDPGEAEPGAEIYVEDIPRKPEKILDFEEFEKIDLKIDKNQKAIYNGKLLKSDEGPVTTDKKVEENAKIQ